MTARSAGLRGAGGARADARAPFYDPALHHWLTPNFVRRAWGVSARWFQGDRVSEAPILVADRPWEATALGCPSIIQDRSRNQFRMYYTACTPRQRVRPNATNALAEYAACVAFSSDGLRWEKPELGLVEYEGSARNNILRLSAADCEEFCMTNVLVDPTAPEAERYKATGFFGGPTDLENFGIVAFVSADGLRWNRRGDYALPREGDSHTMAYDPGRERFILATRSRGTFVKACTNQPFVREIAFSYSKDFRRWTPPKTALKPWESENRKGEEFYYLCMHPYGNGCLGLLQIMGPKHYYMYPTLAYSEDGETWDRPTPNYSLVAVDILGKWTNSIARILSLFEADGGWCAPVSVWARPAPAQGGWGNIETFLYRWRKDGFCCLEGTGEILTEPVSPRLEAMRVNADARQGELRVELLDENLKARPGFEAHRCKPIREDGTSLPVVWKGSPSLRQRPVHVRFILKSARIFAFRF